MKSLSTLCSCFGVVDIRDDKKLPLKQLHRKLSNIQLHESQHRLISANKKKHEWVKDKDSSIIIIGAGQAGIHMASILMRCGFKNVIIMEKDNIYGDKSSSVQDNEYNIIHEMGSSYIHPNYDAFFELIGLYDDSNNELIAIHPDECMINNMTLNEWINGENKLLIKAAATKYIKLHNKIFGEYGCKPSSNLHSAPSSFQFPSKPTNMEDINMTFLEFIKKNELNQLIPYFIYNQSLLEGYGNLNEIPAFYGLLWNNTNSVNILLDPTLQKRENLWMLKKGFHHLFENIVDTEDIHILYNTQITSINRYLNDEKHKICIMYMQNDDDLNEEREKLIQCDVLFTACDISLILPFISDITKEEESIFENISYHTLCTTLFECDDDDINIDVDDGQCHFYPNNLLKDEDGHLFKIKNSSKIINGIDNHCKIKKQKELKKERFIGYQMMNKEPRFIDNKSVQEMLLNDLKEIGMKNVKIIEQNVMRFCPQWTQIEINKGIPWRVKDKLQGKYKNMYYIGSSVCHQSIESILEYNISLQQKLKI